MHPRAPACQDRKSQASESGVGVQCFCIDRSAAPYPTHTRSLNRQHFGGQSIAVTTRGRHRHCCRIQNDAWLVQRLTDSRAKVCPRSASPLRTHPPAPQSLHHRLAFTAREKRGDGATDARCCVGLSKSSCKATRTCTTSHVATPPLQARRNPSPRLCRRPKDHLPRPNIRHTTHPPFRPPPSAADVTQWRR